LVQHDSKRVSEYRIADLSARGALLAHGPAIAEPQQRIVSILLCLPGTSPMIVSARVVGWRRGHSTALAVAFLDRDAELEDRIHDMVLASLSGRAPEVSRTLGDIEWVTLDEAEPSLEAG